MSQQDLTAVERLQLPRIQREVFTSEAINVVELKPDMVVLHYYNSYGSGLCEISYNVWRHLQEVTFQWGAFCAGRIIDNSKVHATASQPKLEVSQDTWKAAVEQEYATTYPTTSSTQPEQSPVTVLLGTEAMEKAWPVAVETHRAAIEHVDYLTLPPVDPEKVQQMQKLADGIKEVAKASNAQIIMGGVPKHDWYQDPANSPDPIVVKQVRQVVGDEAADALKGQVAQQLRERDKQKAETLNFGTELATKGDAPKAAPPIMTKARMKKLAEDGVQLPYLEELRKWAANRHQVDIQGFLFIHHHHYHICFRYDALRLVAAIGNEELVKLQTIPDTQESYVLINETTAATVRKYLFEQKFPEVGVMPLTDDTVHIFLDEAAVKKVDELEEKVQGMLQKLETAKPAYVIKENPIINLTGVIAHYEQTGVMDISKGKIVEQQEQQATKILAEVSTPALKQEFDQQFEQELVGVAKPVPCENCSKPCYPNQESGLCDTCDELLFQNTPQPGPGEPVILVAPIVESDPAPTQFTTMLELISITSPRPERCFPEYDVVFEELKPKGWTAWGEKQVFDNMVHQQPTLIDFLLHYDKSQIHYPSYSIAYEGAPHKPVNPGRVTAIHTLLGYFFGQLAGVLCAHPTRLYSENKNLADISEFVHNYMLEYVPFPEMFHYINTKFEDCDSDRLKMQLNLPMRLLRNVNAARKYYDAESNKNKTPTVRQELMKELIDASAQWNLDPTMPAGYAFWRMFLKARAVLSKAEGQLLGLLLKEYK